MTGLARTRLGTCHWGHVGFQSVKQCPEEAVYTFPDSGLSYCAWHRHMVEANREWLLDRLADVANRRHSRDVSGR